MNASIKKRRTFILVIAALALFFATGVYAAAPKGVTQINLVTESGENVTGDLELYVGTETQLKCKIAPKTFKDRTARYGIADEQIASVDENGSLKALKEGETLLTVECAGTRKNYKIIAKTAVEDITGIDDEVTLYEGEELQLEPEVKMAQKDLEKPQITYEVKRNTIATVDNAGLITAVGEGETTVTVTAGDVTKKVKVIVEAAPAESYTPVVTSNNNSGSRGNSSGRKANKKNTSSNNSGSSSSNSGSSGGDSGGSGGDSGSSGGDSGSSGGDSGSSGGDSGSPGGDSGSSGGDSGSSSGDSENGNGSDTKRTDTDRG